MADLLCSGLLVGLSYSSRMGRFIVSFVLGVLSGSFIFVRAMSSGLIVREERASYDILLLNVAVLYDTSTESGVSFYLGVFYPPKSTFLWYVNF